MKSRSWQTTIGVLNIIASPDVSQVAKLKVKLVPAADKNNIYC